MSQELVLDDVRRAEGRQRDRLRDLQREYSMIETRYKSRIIEDLAGLYYESKEETSQRKVIQSRSGARQQDVTVDIHTQANKNVSKEVYKASREVSKASREASKASRERSERQMVRTKPVDQGSDSSLGHSITITVTRSSRRDKERAGKSPGHKVKSHSEVKMLEQESKSIDATSDDDTLNGTLEIDDEMDKPNNETEKLREENRQLRKKLKRHKNLKNDMERVTVEARELQNEVKVLQTDIATKNVENTLLKTGTFKSESSINEIPERDTPHRSRQVQTVKDLGQKSSSLELDYFTEVIIDDLKKEIRSLKEDVEIREKRIEEKNFKLETVARDNVELSKSLSSVINKSKEGVKRCEESFQTNENQMLSKIKSMKEEMSELKLKSKNQTSDGSEVDKLKAEIESLRKQLAQGSEQNQTLETYINFLKQSYNSAFGAI